MSKVIIFFAVTSYLDNLEMLKTKNPAQSGVFFNASTLFQQNHSPNINKHIKQNTVLLKTHIKIINHFLSFLTQRLFLSI